MSMSISETEVEQMAKVLATHAGIVWDALATYPGFERGRWRSEARRFLTRRETENLARSLH